MMDEQLELHTERLALKVLDESFAERLLQYQLRNRAAWREWNPHQPDEFYTLAAQHERLSADRGLIRAGTGLRLYLFERADTGYRQIIGDLSFNNIVRGAFQSCHLGYRIDAGVLNRGYITEALRCAIEYAFAQLKLHRIEANIIPRNARSRRVVEKLGFEPEGLARKYLKINGVWEDHLHFVIFNDLV
jgi:ribosomal-protein-alanine N-acetyltransferase